MDSTRIEVTSERGTYPVVIGPGASRQLGRLLAAAGIGRQRLVVSSAPIWHLHGSRLRQVATTANPPALIQDGERAKTLATVSRLYDECVKRGLDRSAAIVSFGGGVVGDASGFAAASYLRGISLVQVPTTLLSQVDSAIGGKVGVNLPAGKNLVGAFYSPALVVCDPEVLRTLPPREFRAGLYEVVKYGVIASPALFRQLTTSLPAILGQDLRLLTQLVAACCRIKADVVMADEREGGPRRALNFGHTIGHALESISQYRRFRHGEAIAYGMLAAARLSVYRQSMAADDERALQRLIANMGALPPVTDLKIADALEVIARDKKVVGGRLHFVLAQGIGATVVAADVHTRELARAMAAIGMKR
ncbi:MAG: 3-dehydroquinate synthase [Acidobacteriota bacterium]